MRTLIVDDNEIERLNLRLLLGAHPGIDLVGEAESVDRAVDLIRAESPELIFLDVHLEDQLGFSALEATACDARVIITTAHPKYAVRAFEINAVDYLLKPVMEDNLARALARLPLDGEPPRLGRLAIDDIQLFKRKDGLDAVPVSEIALVTGERIYSKVQLTDQREYLHNRPLREWIDVLPENIFMALDRSTIVNLREIRRINDDRNGGYELAFRNGGFTVPIKKAAMKRLRELL